jgi:hypothetical protein
LEKKINSATSFCERVSLVATGRVAGTHLKQLLDGKLKKADRGVGVDTSPSPFGSSVVLGGGGGGGVYLQQV